MGEPHSVKVQVAGSNPVKAELLMVDGVTIYRKMAPMERRNTGSVTAFLNLNE